MDELRRNLRSALRSLRKNPAISLVAVLALGLGIGANSAIFSVLHGVLLAPLPYPEPDRLVRLIDSAPELGFERFSTSPADFADWRREARSFTDLVAVRRVDVNLTAADSPPTRLQGARITYNYFETLGLPPARGRGFSREEDQADGPRVVLVGHGLWRNRFGGGEALLGSTLTLDGEPHTVIGVAPEEADFPSEVDLWLPMATEDVEGTRGAHYISTLGRLAPGVGLSEAQSEMDTITQRLEEEYPDSNEGWGVRLHRHRDLLVEDVQTALWVLMATVGMVLLIACANVANVLLARLSTRRREVALRSALGSGRGRIVALFLTESVFLALLGGALGLLLAYWGTEILLNLSAGSIPRAAEVGLSLPVLLFTLGVSVVTGLLFGVWPALHASRADLRDGLAEGGRAVAGSEGASRVRGLLVIGEVALAVVLLVAAGLLLRSFASLQGVSPGFETEGVLTVSFSLPDGKYSDESRQRAFFREVNEGLAARPELAGSGIITPLPMDRGNMVLSYTLEDRPFPDPSETPTAIIRFVTPGALEAMGVPLLRGKPLNAADDDGSLRVALINEALAEAMFPGTPASPGNPLGVRFTFGNPTAEDSEWVSIAGVVGNLRGSDLESDPEGEIYLPIYQNLPSRGTVLLRGEGGRMPSLGPVRALLSEIDPDLPLARVMPLGEVVAETYAGQRFNMVLLAIFAGLALVLAAIGVYGVVSYGVSQRSHEMGLRMALGAQPGQVLGLVLRQGMAPVLAGVVLGLLLAPVVGRLLESLLFGVDPTDVKTLFLVALVLTLTALLATWLPARRATRVSPMVALREE